MRLFLLKLARR
jgi:hypothetical protein